MSASCAPGPAAGTRVTQVPLAFVTQGTQIGLAVAVIGLLVLAFWPGHTIGRRTSSNKQ
ncbi:hypothetical protein [Arthrobacter sp. Z4-13]